jgi:hypothetical protein
MDCAALGPDRAVRGKAGFVDLRQFDRAGLRLGNESLYVALGLREALGIALFLCSAPFPHMPHPFQFVTQGAGTDANTTIAFQAIDQDPTG